ncbi:MAG: porin family protein [Breznakibacter sp.]
MKLKKTVAALFLATISTVSFSQIHFGAKVGLNISQIEFSSNTGTDESPRLAPVFGAFAEISINDKFSFQPELHYSMEGTVMSGSMYFEEFDEEIDMDITFKTDYLNIPLLAKYKFGNGLCLQAGPQIGFLMKAKVTAEAEDVEATEDAEDAFESLNTSIALGAAYELKNGLGFDLRYNFGLSNVLKDSGDETGRLNTLQISAFYKF